LATPSLLIIGHLCHDLLPSEEIKLGGTAAYAAFLAKEMGAEVNIITSVGVDFGYFELFKKEGISIHNIPAKKTTVFENIYPEGEERVQYLHARASIIHSKNIPNNIPEPDLVLFCPIANEVDFSILSMFPKTMKAATIQGWLRDWDGAGKVFPKSIEWQKLLPLDLLVFSDADMVGFENNISKICQHVPLVIMTRGKNGVRVFHKNKETDFPTKPIEVKDATGAGDSFAIAFLLDYYANLNIDSAVEFGQSKARELILKRDNP